MGGSIGGSESESHPVNVDPRFPEQQQLWKALMPFLLAGISGPAPSYPGQMYVPWTSQETAWANHVENLRTGALAGVFAGEVPYEMGTEWAEKYYEESIRPQALREFQEITLPQIKGAFAGPGYYGSARALTETKSAYDLATDLAGQRAQLMYGEEMYSRQAQERALERQMMAEQYALGAEYQAGELARQIAQEEIMGNLQRWLSGEEVDGQYNWAYNPYIQLVYSLLGMEGYQQGQVSESSSSQYSASLK